MQQTSQKVLLGWLSSETSQTGIRSERVRTQSPRFLSLSGSDSHLPNPAVFIRLLLPCASRGLPSAASAIVITVILSAAAALGWLFRDDSGDGAHDIRAERAWTSLSRDEEDIE